MSHIHGLEGLVVFKCPCSSQGRWCSVQLLPARLYGLLLYRAQSTPANYTTMVSLYLNVLKHSKAHKDATKDANGPAVCGACAIGSVNQCEGLGHTHDT